MAPAPENNLGTDINVVALVTSAAAGNNTRVIFGIHYYDDAKTLTGATDNGPGYTWVVDRQQKHGDNGHRVGIISAYATSGLASGRTITPTFSGGGSAAFPGEVMASSWTGVASGTSGYAEATDGSGAYDTVWAVSLASTGDALLYAVSYAPFFDPGGIHTADTGNGYTELHGEFGNGATERFVDVYRVVSSTATYTPGGTWSGGTSIALEADAGVAYDAAAAASGGSSFRRRAAASMAAMRRR